MVNRTKVEKIEFINKIKLWEVIPQADKNPLYRSRLVAKEIRSQSPHEHWFAATPPRYSVKLLMSLAMTKYPKTNLYAKTTR
eukprot:1458358-Amphidinium_carterae.1